MRIINATRFQCNQRLAFYLCLCALLLLQGCSQKANDVTQFGSHKITVSRHDFTYGAYIEERGKDAPVLEKSLHPIGEAKTEEHKQEASFHYTGFSFTSGRFQVAIKDEQVVVNGQVYGQLKRDDTVSIGDDGVRVNSMDYGESARYLHTNSEQARP